MSHKIYCFNNGGGPQWLSAVAIADDGHILGRHCCSDEYYMRHDLGMDGSNWKHENYDKHFGAGNWELVWIDNPRTSPELDAAFALNKALGEHGHPATKPAFVVEFSDGSKVDLTDEHARAAKGAQP